MYFTLLDDHGLVLWVSQAPADVPEDELVGKPVWNLAAPAVADEIRAAFDRAVSGRESDCLITLFMNGSTRHFRGVFRPVALSTSTLVLLTQCEVQPEFRRLSTRQREVLRCLIDCRSNAELSQRLRVSERTVESHLRNIRRTLSLSTRGCLIAFATRHFQEI